MRLTLRTLLSYLDDMLEPAQAKEIGAKVAESEQAREQMERIKQVTRKRRLTTPAATGPGGMDPNTIAEYLDNEVSPEKATEVEQICLASDVHLAEVAACHQILTLVLGEPALVPPTARQRMYGLVKGPEAIHHRKHTKAARKRTDSDLSSEIDDSDDSLRLGITLKGLSSQRKALLIFGSGALAACLLMFAIWQLMHSTHGDPKPDQHVHADKDKTDKDKNDKDKIEPPKDEKKLVKPNEPPNKPEKKPDAPPEAKPDNNPPVLQQPKVESVKIEPTPEIEYKPANPKQQPIGKYLIPNPKEPAAFLELGDKKRWNTISTKNAAVFSGRPLLCLPGGKGVVLLDSGVELTLWGNLPELTFDPVLAESMVTVHPNDRFDADLTLERGRILLRNLKDKNVQVRLRCEDPTQDKEQHFDLVLFPESSVAVERSCDLRKDEPFYENPKDRMRKGPIATVRWYLMSRSVSVKFGGIALTIDETHQRILEWQSNRGALGTPTGAVPPAWMGPIPAAKNQTEAQERKKASEVANTLARAVDTKPIYVALEEAYQGVEQDVKAKRNPMDIWFQWRHALKCSAAVDDIGRVFEDFQADTTPIIVRGLCLQTMHQWLAWNREHEYVMQKMLTTRYRGAQPVKIMELIHPVSPEETAKHPERYQQYIDGLTSELMPIRILSHWQLVMLVPWAPIPYDPAMPRLEREKAQKSWHALIPAGKLPPPPPKMKKDKAL